MCGIVGEIAFKGGGTDGTQAEILYKLIDLAARRGPDGRGTWTDGTRCTLGFRRLSILDLSSAGDQPMSTPDGRFAIVYNGEVYNFGELRRDLEREGVRFRSTGDTEVVLFALALWGNEALSRFNGMFALGFYDVLEKRLLLARDHAGIKPLYYLHTSEGLVFASQYDQILEHPWSGSLRVSSAAIALYLRLGYIPSPYALLEQTRMLEPGAWLEITAENRVTKGRFFEFNTLREANLHGEEAFDAVDAAVGAAVKRQLVSDVPVGTFLSGGVDSPLVTANARVAANTRIPSFTLGLGADPLDESADAAAYAAEIGVEHVVEHIAPDESLDLIDDVVKACGEPFADYSMFPTLMVSRLARRHVKVVLSGDGGDELFWGYAARFASVLETTDDFVKTGATATPGWNVRRLIESGLGNADAGWPTSLGDSYRLKHTHLPETVLRRVFPDIPDWPAEFGLFDHTTWETEPTARWLRWNEFNGFLSMVLLKVDRASMHESLEVRIPLLDKEVIDVAARVDWTSCLDVERRIGKLPLRHALARHVRHQTRTKRGFTVPMDAWLRGPLRPIFEDMVLGRTDILGLPMDENAVRATFDRHLAGEKGLAMGLWILLSLFLWIEEHGRERS
ncbi:MAG TPA: asparagine synthase (glutamine-hydrolyzing) [Rhodothermales bacterium]|nr:asparagine synthase (glutamine-hydrolyzing) [Rhodothermales bacterium]